MKNNVIGRVVRVEYEENSGKVELVMEILDPVFKARIIHGKDFQDILSIKGKDIVVVEASKKDV